MSSAENIIKAKKLSSFLRRLIEDSKFTRYQISKKTKVSQTTLHEFMEEKIFLPSVVNIFALLELLAPKTLSDFDRHFKKEKI